MHEVRQYDDTSDKNKVVELWQKVFGYETAHNDPNLTISKKLGCLKVKLQILASNQSTAAFYESLGYAIEPNISMGKLL